MQHAYNTDEIAKSYEGFLASTDGKIFRNTIGGVFTRRLHELSPQPARILDAGCGDGWLAGLLSGPPPLEEGQGEVLVKGSDTSKDSMTPSNSPSRGGGQSQKLPPLEIHACDAGEPLIASAKQKYPLVEFTVCDLNQPLSYQKEYFDIITASMVIHDVENELATLTNMADVLKPGGKLLATVVNPYYGYPIGEWKRGIIGRLLFKKPKLRLARFYNDLMRQNRPNFEWRPNLGSHFTPLSTHISNATKAGFALTGLEDIQSAVDSPTYNLTYQLHRFPIILLLEFTKL